MRNFVLSAVVLSAGGLAVCIPAHAATVILQPGDNIQARVDAAPSGSVFQFAAGVFRLQTIRPRSGDSYVGTLDSNGGRVSVLSGARLLTSFTQAGSAWVAAGQTQEGARLGPSDATPACESSSPRCAYPEDLYFDDKPLLHVASLSDLAPGRWFFDYAADKIYFYDNPTGHKIEASVLPTAFNAVAGQTDVTVQNLIVEKYAVPAQQGAIWATTASRWMIQGNEVRLNHGRALSLCCGQDTQVLKNILHHNGQLGIGTYDTDRFLIQDNEIAYNNYAGYNVWWEAGGSKFTSSRDLIVRGNYSHHNLAEGLWTDSDNIRTLYENNWLSDNLNHGIHHEISYSVTFRGNHFERNGLPGLLISNSQDVEVVGNTFVGNDTGHIQIQARQLDHTPSGLYGPHVLSNLYVHGNVSEGAAALLTMGAWAGDTSFYTSRNNRFQGNTYTLTSRAARFGWQNGDRSVAEWKGYGNDVAGTFIYKDKAVVTDADGDGKSDITIWRPSEGQWYVKTSPSNFASSLKILAGVSSDLPVIGDYDGDRKADLAVWRPSTGYWYIKTSASGFAGTQSIRWGIPGDIPISGDFDGDGKTDLAVWRSAEGTKVGMWYLLLSGSNFSQVQTYQWGVPKDIPLGGCDFDGDGKTDLVVWRPSDGKWYIKLSATGFTDSRIIQWGQPGDIPVGAGDYDGDGITDIAVWRPVEGTQAGLWYIQMSKSNFTVSKTIQWGARTDVPIAGADYDGDGITDIVVWRPTEGDKFGLWYILTSASNFSQFQTQQWGLPTDTPMVGALPAGLAAGAGETAITMTPDSLSGVVTWPNPWRADRHGSIPTVKFSQLPADATVKIFTVSGRLAATLPPSSPSTTWNLKNTSGDPVASGLYLYLITTRSGLKKTGTLAVVR